METPVGVRYSNDRRQGSLSETSHLYAPHIEPVNEFQTLMESEPGHEYSDGTHGIDLQALVETAGLTPKELAALELVVFGGMSDAKAGVYMAEQFRPGKKPYWKSAVAKHRHSALEKIRTVLAEQEPR